MKPQKKAVTKYKYVSAEKNDELTKKLSFNKFISPKNENKNSTPGLDLDNVWSIKRNVSINNRAKHPNETNPYIPIGMIGGCKTISNESGTFYSRHRNPPTKMRSQSTIDNSTTPRTTKSWLQSSYDAKNNVKILPSANDEFDLPSSSNNKTISSKMPMNSFNSFQKTGM